MKKTLLLGATAIGLATTGTALADNQPSQLNQYSSQVSQQNNKVTAYTKYTLKGGSYYAGKDANNKEIDYALAESTLQSFSKDTGIPLGDNTYTVESNQKEVNTYNINAYENHIQYEHLLWGFSYNPQTHEVNSLYSEPELNYWHKATDGTYINPDMSMGQTIVHNDPSVVGNQDGEWNPEQQEAMQNPIENQPADLNSQQVDPDKLVNGKVRQIPNHPTIRDNQKVESAKMLPQTGNATNELPIFGLALLALPALFIGGRKHV